jgi:hypothetical protein
VFARIALPAKKHCHSKTLQQKETAVNKINMPGKGMPAVAFTAGVYENMKDD